MNLNKNSMTQREQGFVDFVSQLQFPAVPNIHLEKLQTGIDNLHIDVMLSQRFQQSLSRVVWKIIQEDLARNGYPIFEGALTDQELEAFRNVYRDLCTEVLEKNNQGDIDTIALLQLLQLSLLKVFLDRPGMVLDEFRGKLKHRADASSSSHSGRSLELYESLLSLSKYGPRLHYQTLRRLFNLVQQIEAEELTTLRKSVLGVSWVTPKLLFFNPMLHLPDLRTESYILNHYPLVLTDQENGEGFVETNRIVCEVFDELLPAWIRTPPAGMISLVEPPGDEGHKMRQREWRGGFSGFLEGHRLLEQCLSAEEFNSYRVSWLDIPANVDTVLQYFNEGHGFSFSNTAAGVREKDLPATDDLSFQQHITEEFSQRLEAVGLLSRVIASYHTPRLYRALKEQVPVQVIYQYLSGRMVRRDLLQRLKQASPENNAANLRSIDAIFDFIQSLSAAKKQEYIIRYIKDFLAFRRDLKLAHYTYQQMSYIRLRTDPEEIKLSSENGTLYEFHLSSEKDIKEQKIGSHVILKADVRGSTQITQELMERRLNPATHFSDNFFNPINKLLDRYGAHKVFVEGDALILTVFESSELGTRDMSVANTCGLACQILAVIKSQNQNHNLPKLELGLGIAYMNGTPAYLYDDEKKIMISPAINRADRLSSCSCELRRDTSWKNGDHHSIEVVEMPESNGDESKILRYNVNGIELDKPTFLKLRKEIAMRNVSIQNGAGCMDDYFIGRFIDRHRTQHWLVVREAPVRQMQSDGALLKVESDARFYEVICNDDLIRRIKEQVHAELN